MKWMMVIYVFSVNGFQEVRVFPFKNELGCRLALSIPHNEEGRVIYRSCRRLN